MTEAVLPTSLRRQAVAWLAVVGLLSNFLLPAAMSVAAGRVGFSICSTRSAGDPSGKAKPGLLVHHCALCSVPAALPLRPPPAHYVPAEIAAANPPQPGVITLSALPRHGHVQARAPPDAA
jgi:Protein of unknown function (DUF2946)